VTVISSGGLGGVHLAEVYDSVTHATDLIGSVESDGNARLIAAAPDMYRLIRKCYKVLHMGVWEVDETDQEVCEQINDAMWNHFGDDWRPRSDEVV
jgi:hypothetical protein